MAHGATELLRRAAGWERRQQVVRALRRTLRPARLDVLQRTSPVSANWGRDRGTPIDRYPIERFLEEERSAIRGRVLEVKDSGYTRRFASGVERVDVLDIDASNAQATIVADLAVPDGIPANAFDCFILTQTLQFVYDVRAAVDTCHRVLRPGGVVLCTVPATSRVQAGSLEHEYWRFTTASCTRLFGDVFGPENVLVRSHGNVLTSIGFLTGLAHEELSREELDADDPYFPLIVTVRATKR